MEFLSYFFSSNVEDKRSQDVENKRSLESNLARQKRTKKFRREFQKNISYKQKAYHEVLMRQEDPDRFPTGLQQLKRYKSTFLPVDEVHRRRTCSDKNFITNTCVCSLEEKDYEEPFEVVVTPPFSTQQSFSEEKLENDEEHQSGFSDSRVKPVDEFEGFEWSRDDVKKPAVELTPDPNQELEELWL